MVKDKTSNKRKLEHVRTTMRLHWTCEGCGEECDGPAWLKTGDVVECGNCGWQCNVGAITAETRPEKGGA